MFTENRKEIEREFHLEAYRFTSVGRFVPENNLKKTPNNGIKVKPIKWT